MFKRVLFKLTHCFALTCRVFKVVALKSTEQMTLRYYAVYIMPVGFFMAATFHFGNLVYLHLTVSFIQMLKAFTPIMTMVLLFVARLETPTRRMVYSVLIVAFGTGGSDGSIEELSVGLFVEECLSFCKTVTGVLKLQLPYNQQWLKTAPEQWNTFCFLALRDGP